MTTVTGITSITLFLQVSPFKMFWIAVMLFCIAAILYQLHITDWFYFERNARACYKVQNRCAQQKRRFDLVRVGEEQPRNDFERAVVKMNDEQYFQLIYQMLYENYATRLIAGSYKAAYRAQIEARGYVRTEKAAIISETTPLADAVQKLPTDGQRVTAPADSVGEGVENVFEFEPVLTTKGYRAKLR